MAGKNGPKSVTATPEPMELWIENHPLPVNETKIFEMKNNNDTKNYSSMSVEDNGEQWSYHVTEIRNESARIVIDLFNKTYCSSFTVYLRQDKQPTTEKYLMKWSLPNNASCKWKNESAHFGTVLFFYLLLPSVASKDSLLFARSVILIFNEAKMIRITIFRCKIYFAYFRTHCMIV